MFFKYIAHTERSGEAGERSGGAAESGTDLSRENRVWRAAMGCAVYTTAGIKRNGRTEGRGGEESSFCLSRHINTELIKTAKLIEFLLTFFLRGGRGCVSLSTAFAVTAEKGRAYIPVTLLHGSIPGKCNSCTELLFFRG